MGNKNRKATKEEMERIRRVIGEAFPQYEPVFGAHGDYGGYRAPRDHTIAFRLRGEDGKYHSNVTWLMPNGLKSYTVEDIRKMVAMSGGTKQRQQASPKKKNC